MRKFTFLFIFLCSTILVGEACQKQAKTNHNLQRPEGNKSLDYSKVKLIIERGAFHYDTFEVSPDSVRFLPKEEKCNVKLNQEFYTRSSAYIGEEKFKDLVDWILENDFLEMKDFYEEHSSCTSGLTIILEIDGQKKKVTCTDFKRGCPELLYQIEQKVIQLHGQQLERKFLPG